jgi:hypothetical protein
MIQYLQQISEAKNIHQLHIEQFSLEGIDKLRAAIKTFQTLRDQLMQVGVSPSQHSVSVKWDGAPAIIAGINPEDGQFFVSTKSAFTKTPKIARTPEETSQFKEAVGDKLTAALKYLSRINMDGVYQGDLMFTSSMKKLQVIDNVEYITFRPNTILYAVPRESPLGQKIERANFGIVFHTKYIGDTFESMNSEPIQSVSFLKSSDVWWITAAMPKDASGKINFTTQEASMVHNNLSQVGKLFNKLSQDFYKGLKETNLDVAIERTINSFIKRGSFIEDLEHFIAALKEMLPVALSGKRARMSLEFIQNNRDKIIALMTIYKLLYDTKIIFLNKFNSLESSVRSFSQDAEGYKATNPEGFVVVDLIEGHMTKLVDRLNFSKQNFNAVKEWGK